MLYTLLAIVCLLAAVALLFTSWRSAKGLALCNTCGWLLIALALVLWSLSQGAEFGISFSLLLLPLIAWAIITVNRDNRIQKVRVQPRERLGRPSIKAFFLHAWRLICCVLLSGLGSAFGFIGFATLLPLSPVNAIVLGVFVIPLVWGAAAYWLLADTKTWRPPVGILCIGAAGAAIIYV